MYCERCRERHKWYEDVCPTCRGPLVPDPPGIASEPEARVVTVFSTADEGLLPLATLALDQAGIEYAVRKLGLSDVFGVSHPTPGFDSTGLAVSIQVLEDDVTRAREILVDLEQAEPQPLVEEPEEPEPPLADVTAPAGRVELFDGETGRPVGAISREAFDWLSARLVRESAEDRDYWIDLATVQMLADAGGDGLLLDVLRRALETRDGVNIRWR